MHAVAGCRSGSPRVQRSDFDTVVGVYDQSLNQITCVDDAATPLAELSLLTEPGVQYLSRWAATRRTSEGWSCRSTDAGTDRGRGTAQRVTR